MTRHLLIIFVIGFLLFPFVSAAEEQKPADAAKVAKIDLEQFDHKRQEKNAVVLDVRTPEEFARGHVPGAVNLDFFDPQFRAKIDKLDRHKTYLVHCAKGVRSRQAASQMQKLDFPSLFDFSGGFEQWKKAGKPIEKPPTDKEPSKH